MDNTQKTFDRNQYMPPQQKSANQVQPGSSFTVGSAHATPLPPGAGGNGSNVPKKMKGYLIMGGVVIALIVIALLAITRNSSGPSSATTGASNQLSGTPATVIPTLDGTKPSLQFTGVANTAYPIEEQFTVQLLANSQGADVNGYDILLPYNKDELEIIEVTSLLDTFQIYQFDRGDYYSITGIKLLSAQGAAIFADQPILEFTLRGKKPGKYTLQVMSERGKETSKFVDKDVKIIKPQFQPIIVEIQ